MHKTHGLLDKSDHIGMVLSIWNEHMRCIWCYVCCYYNELCKVMCDVDSEADYPRIINKQTNKQKTRTHKADGV